MSRSMGCGGREAPVPFTGGRDNRSAAAHAFRMVRLFFPACITMYSMETAHETS